MQLSGAIERVLIRIRHLHADAEANQPLQFNRRLSAAEQRENERRRDRGDQIAAEIIAANAEAARLREAYAQALASEKAPQPVEPSPALKALYERHENSQMRLGRLTTARADFALKAADGDTAAQKSLAKCCEDQARIATELENLALAIGQAEKREAEENREFFEREADEKHRVGLAAAENLIAWAEKVDNHLSYLASHFAELPALQKALAKSGANINTDVTSRLFIKAAHDRAVKAKGLHRFLNIDASVDGVPLGEAYRSLLRAAVRRPNVRGNEHEHSN